MTREVEFSRRVSFQLHTGSGVPPYLQLVEQVRQAIRMGALQVGDRLPTVKDVVAEVTVNPNTVLKAYRELEHEGLVEGRQGVGTFVCGRPQGPPPRTQLRLARELRDWVASAVGEGLDDEAILAMVRAELRATYEGIA